MTPENRSAYWRANLRLLGAIRIGGFKLGFWFAQQGSIYIFVLLIFFYAWRMNKLDQKYDVHED